MGTVVAVIVVALITTYVISALWFRIPLIIINVINVVNDLRQVGGFLRVLQFPPPTTDKTDRHDITEILLKVALNTIT